MTTEKLLKELLGKLEGLEKQIGTNSTSQTQDWAENRFLKFTEKEILQMPKKIRIVIRVNATARFTPEKEQQGGINVHTKFNLIEKVTIFPHLAEQKKKQKRVLSQKQRLLIFNKGTAPFLFQRTLINLQITGLKIFINAKLERIRLSTT